jgi:hypothetical protein
MTAINERVLELMQDLGLDTNDEMLVIKVTIIYLTGQRDQLVESGE